LGSHDEDMKMQNGVNGSKSGVVQQNGPSIVPTTSSFMVNGLKIHLSDVNPTNQSVNQSNGVGYGHY